MYDKHLYSFLSMTVSSSELSRLVTPLTLTLKKLLFHVFKTFFLIDFAVICDEDQKM